MNDPKEEEYVFLIADLSGYTALTEAHGNLSAADVVTRYAQIIDVLLHPGVRLVDRVGDEALIVASDASELLAVAIAFRKAVEQEPLFPSVHMGLHAGTAVKKDGRYFGKALNLTSRVASHASGGQILCTREVVSRANKKSEVAFCSIGRIRFKNIPDPVDVYEVLSRKDVMRNPLDPVCRMQVKPDDAPAKLPFEGKTYFFCSFECAKAFAENPDRFLV